MSEDHKKLYERQWVCLSCYGTDVSTDMWQNLNDDSLSAGQNEYYCSNCGETKVDELNREQIFDKVYGKHTDEELKKYKITVSSTDTYTLYAIDEQSALNCFDEGKDLLDLDPELTDSVIEDKTIIGFSEIDYSIESEEQ